jgi:hypothetical protein
MGVNFVITAGVGEKTPNNLASLAPRVMVRAMRLVVFANPVAICHVLHVKAEKEQLVRPAKALEK